MEHTQTQAARHKENELMIIRVLNAPRELVWKVWTDPGHIRNWWGPEGFTNTIFTMDVKPGGEWDFVMHGPDGTDFRNRSVYTHVEPMERIAFDHVSGPKFHAEARFEARGEQTVLTWRMIFDQPEELDNVIKVFKADDGLTQNVNKLERYLVQAGK